mmetsp:Transcript_28374/g.92664  ORF Transcript_28374/g.92664 Transcript_28374/m.92664 type:complete len:84 (-) Transcript_28374:278-529(-)
MTQFPVMDKVIINGPGTCEVYRFLKDPRWAEQNKFKDAVEFHALKWNYEKFLINANGEVLDHLNSGTDPLVLEGKIKQLLMVP